jgi:UrcA family protein
MDTKAASPNYPTFNSSSTATRILGGALALGLGVWLTAVAGGIAYAHTAPAPAVAVSYADIDATTADGAETLAHRIDVAAKTACGAQAHSPLLPRESGEHHKCVVSATEAALSRVDASIVAQLNKAPAGISLAAR